MRTGWGILVAAACVVAVSAAGVLGKGSNSVSVLLKEPQNPVSTRWVLSDGSQKLVERTWTWNPPRHWTIYVVKSAHVDIGLHDSQYKQRLLTVDSIDRARQLADQTADWPDASRYRYVIEGLWWWLNYPQDRSERAANEVVEKYVKRGLFAIGPSHSGNHTQAYGTEELCRSAYYARQLRERWNVAADTMLMVNNNGITWPLVTAYADAGIRNLLFLPNAWNPKTVGGSRIDVGWDSPLPHLFYWQGPDEKSRLLRIEEQGPVPPAPEIAVGEISDKSVTLRWAAVPGARQYNVYRGQDADFAPDEYHLLVTTRQTQFTDDWLKAGTAYHYRVAAVDAESRQGAPSDPVYGTTKAAGDSPPAKVGTAYSSGLISDPRAWRGDEPDILYLQWGQNMESDLSHYELYRGATSDFELNETTFVAKVEPGPYVVVPFEDKGLQPHTAYYYRVRAVDRDGHKGPPSEVCRGVTREVALYGKDIE